MDCEPAPAFGHVLKRYRLAVGLTQETLAERAGLSVRTVSDLERGVNLTPRKDTLPLLATALGLSSEEGRRLEAAAQRLKRAAVTRPLPSGPPLVGREQEVVALERHLAGAGPPLLLLAGESGIGKTRLLQAAIPQAVGSGLRVLEGGCQRRGGQEPYAPLVGALRRHIRGQRPDTLRAELHGCAWLVRLLPELAEGPIPPLPSWTLSAEQERHLMEEAVVRFLANVAGPAGMVLVLDDLQWAGPDALELLATLLRSAGHGPLRVIGAYRDTEVPPHGPLAALLADLAAAELVAQRHLGSLRAEEAAQLLDDLLERRGEGGGETVRRSRVLERAGGVPFFLVSCAQALRQAGAEGGDEEAVPWDVAQSVRQRVALLPEAARELLGVAAVAGRVTPRTLLVGLATRPEEAVLAAFDAVCRAHLLEEQGADAYRFAHDVIREVVEADLGAARRAVLHRRVAAALERSLGEREPPVEVLAYHYGRSDVHDKAVRYLEQAGDRARAQFANVAAEGYYRELVQRLEARGQGRAAADACEKLGDVLITTAQFDAALAVLDGAATIYRTLGDVEHEGRVMARIGWAYAELDAPAEGIARLQPVVAQLEAGASAAGARRVLATLYVTLARLHIANVRPDEQVAAAARALALARTVGEDDLLTTALGRQGLALLYTGQRSQGLQVLEEARARAEAAGDLATLCRVLLNATAHGYLVRGDFATSRQHVERLGEAAKQLGNPTFIAGSLSVRGLLAFFTGEWGQARADTERAVLLSRQSGVVWVLADTLASLGQVYLGLGAWEEASRYLEEALTMAERGRRHRQQYVHGLLAEGSLLQGQPEAARARLLPLIDAGAAGILARLAWAYLELDSLGAAAEAVRQATTQARAQHSRVDLLEALRVQALVALRRRQREEAEQALAEGLALARSLPHPYAEARLLRVYGEMYLAWGEPHAARARLEEALAIFRRLGARKDIERGQSVLAALEGTAAQG